MARSIYDIVTKDKEKRNSPALASYLLESDAVPEFISTNVVSLNLLFSGQVNGGIPKGKLSMISAPSMLGKSFIAMGIVKNAQKKGMNIVVIDTERAFSFKLAKGLGINTDDPNLVVLQENNIVEIKQIILKITNEIPKSERGNTLFIIDSWGALVTNKAIVDGLTGNDVVDMSAPQKKNTLANVCLNTFATFFVVNHVYDNTGGFGDPLAIPGGRKIVFNCDCIVLGQSRAKDKNAAKELLGHIVTALTFKSRYSVEKTKLKFKIKHHGGLDTFYGLEDDALEGGFLNIPKQGYYSRMHIDDDKPIKKDKIYTADFWIPVFRDTDFKDYLERKYTYTSEFDMVDNEAALEEIETSEL